MGSGEEETCETGEGKTWPCECDIALKDKLEVDATGAESGRRYCEVNLRGVTAAEGVEVGLEIRGIGEGVFLTVPSAFT